MKKLILLSIVLTMLSGCSSFGHKSYYWPKECYASPEAAERCEREQATPFEKFTHDVGEIFWSLPIINQFDDDKKK